MAHQENRSGLRSSKRLRMLEGNKTRNDKPAYDSPKDSFACVWESGKNHHLVVPKGFVKKWWTNLYSPLQLISSGGLKASVEVWNDNGELVFTDEWDQFAKTNYVNSGSWLVYFKYFGGNTFGVHFFDRDGNEFQAVVYDPRRYTPVDFCIAYKHPTTWHKTAKIPSSFVDVHRQNLRNPLTIHCDNKWSYEVSFRNLNQHMWLEGGWEFMLDDLDIKHDSFIFCTYLRNSEFTLKVIADVGIDLEHSHANQIAGKTEEPPLEDDIWVATITPLMVHRNDPLEVPMEMAMKLFVAWQKTVEVILPDGEMESWGLKWFLTAGTEEDTTLKCIIEQGWHQVAKDGVIALGDGFRFYRRSGERILRVGLQKTN